LEPRGLWQDVFAALATCDDQLDIALIDSTVGQAHRSAAGAKGGAGAGNRPLARRAPHQEPLPRRWPGAPNALLLTPGQTHDIQGARALLAAAPTSRTLIADKAYDTDDLRQFLAARGTTAVIPPRSRRLTPPPFDPVAYRQRNLSSARSVGSRIGGIATRYDKTGRNFLAGLCLVTAITHWLQ
jgi:transposase